MNKAYRLIWSKVKEAWVVVAEKVAAKGGMPATVVLAAALLLAAGSAFGLPTGAQVMNGTVGINTIGNSMTITNSPNAIINWQGFSIAAGEATRFIQQSSASTVLNRVVGGNASQIYGSLQSNGKVFLINPNGVLFGPGATVNVNGLVASTLNLTNSDFLAGKMKFSGDQAVGKVENQGAITTPAGGSVYLIAPNVENSGVITAPNGDILLAAGKEVLLVDKDNPEIAVVATAPEGQALNLGTLAADAGRIGVYGSIVKQKGIINANSAVQDASGRIFLKAAKEVAVAAGSSTTANGPAGGSITVQATEGTTLVSGTVETKGAAGKGGTVQLLGRQVGLIDQAAVDAGGASGGGTVLVGGDYQGKNADIQNAQATYMGKDTVIKADATNAGNGGKVILWADEVTRAYGSISARGGANGGDGGFVETSGKVSLDANNIRVSTAALFGLKGSWLLDPSDITITSSGVGSLTGGIFDPVGASGSISWSTIEGGLAGGNVTIQTSGGTGGSGDITADDGYYFANAGAGVLTLHADRDIILNRTSMDLEGNPQGLTLLAGRNVAINNSITIANVNITATTGYISSSSTSIISTTSPSGITLSAATGIYGENSSTALHIEDSSLGKLKLAVHNTGAGPIRIADGSYAGLELTGATQAASGQLISISTSGGMTPDLSITGALSAPNGTIELNAAGAITQTAAISGGTLNTSSAWGTTLNHASNAVASFSGINATSGDIVLVNTAASLTLNGSNIVNNAADADINISNTGAITTVGWLATSADGSISLAATNGSITVNNSLLASNDGAGAGSVSVTATGAASDIVLNNINVYSGSTGGGSGSISLNAGRDIKLTPAAVATTADVSLQAARTIQIDAPGSITAGSAYLNATAGGTIGGTGTINAPIIGLQYLSGTSQVGISSASPLLTSGVTSMIALGMSGTGPSAVYLSHTGDLSFSSLNYTAPNAPIEIAATGDLTAPGLDSGTAGLFLKSGGLLSFMEAVDIAGADVTLVSDRMNIGDVNTISASGVVWLKPETSGSVGINLGSTVDSTPNTLELSAIELTKITSAGVLRIGDATSGAMTVSAAISSTPSILSLLSGSTVSQSGSGAITAASLAVQAGGAITLDTNTNSVTNLAATTSSAAISFSNSGNLVVEAIDSVSGIGTSGTVSLTSGGAIAQSADITASSLTTSSVGGTILENAANQVSSFSAANTSSGELRFKNSTALTVGMVAQSASNLTVVESEGDMTLGAVTAGGSVVTLRSHNGSIIDGNASAVNVTNAYRVDFNDGTTTNPGATGSPGDALEVSSLGTGGIIAQSGSGGIFIDNTAGALALSGINHTGTIGDIVITSAGNITVPGAVVTSFGNNNVSISATGSATLTTSAAINKAGSGLLKLEGDTVTINSNLFGNSGNIELRAGTGGLSISSGALSAENLTLISDKMNIGPSSSISASSSGLVWFKPKTAGTLIDLGSVTDVAANTLELSDAELDRVLVADAVKVGDATAGNLAVSSALSFGLAKLGLASGGAISQAAAITAFSVAATSGGAISLGNAANDIDQFAAQSGGAVTLTSASSSFGVNAITLPGASAVNGVSSANNPISIAASGGALGVNAPIDAGTSTVALSSAGAFNPSALITTDELTVTAAGGITMLGSAVQQVHLTNNGTGNISYSGNVGAGNTLAIDAGNTAGAGSIILNEATGNMQVVGADASSDITARSLAGSLTVNGDITSGGLILLEGQSITHASGSTIDAQNVRMDATLATTGALTLQGIINSYETIELRGDNLTTTGADLNVDGSSIQHEITIRPHTDGRSITVGAGGSGLVISDTSETVFNAPTLVIGDEGTSANSYTDASGAILVDADITRSQRLALISGANITQSAGTAVTADALGLITSGSGSVTLSENNAINKMIGKTDSGSITLKSTHALTLVEIIGGVQNPDTYTGIVTNSGNINLTTTGSSLTLNKPIAAGTGTVTLNASGGALIDATASIGVTAASLSATAGTDIGSAGTPFKTAVSLWDAVSSSSGSIYLENVGPISIGANGVSAAGAAGLIASSNMNFLGAVSSGSSVSLTAVGSIGGTASTVVNATTFNATAGTDIGSSGTPFMVQVNNLGTVSAGNSIYLENTGALTTVGAITATSGDLVLKANSPLTIGSGGASAGGDIMLVASASGGGDDLTLNGLVSAGGSLSLQAGDAIYENVTPMAGGTITRTPNLNNPTQLPEEEVVPPSLETVPLDPPLYGDTGEQAPEGLTLVAGASDAAEGEDNDDEEDKVTGTADGQRPKEEKRDEKPKKNYCN